MSVEQLRAIAHRLQDAAKLVSSVAEEMEKSGVETLDCEVKTLTAYSQKCVRFAHNIDGDWLEQKHAG